MLDEISVNAFVPQGWASLHECHECERLWRHEEGAKGGHLTPTIDHLGSSICKIFLDSLQEEMTAIMVSMSMLSVRILSSSYKSLLVSRLFPWARPDLSRPVRPRRQFSYWIAEFSIKTL